MQLRITTSGTVVGIYGEAIDLGGFGILAIRRGSMVEPTSAGEWTADMSPVGGPTLGPFASRSLALVAEQDWLHQYWLDSVS